MKKIKIGKDQFKVVCHYCQKTYHTNSKGYSTTNLLNHVSNYVKNPNRDALKGEQTLAFEPKMNGEEGFNLYQQPLLLRLLRKHSLK